MGNQTPLTQLPKEKSMNDNNRDELPGAIYVIIAVIFALLVIGMINKMTYQPPKPGLYSAVNPPYPTLIEVENPYDREARIIALIPEGAEVIEGPTREYLRPGRGSGLELSPCDFHFTIRHNDELQNRTYTECLSIQSGDTYGISEVVIRTGETAWTNPPHRASWMESLIHDMFTGNLPEPVK